MRAKIITYSVTAILIVGILAGSILFYLIFTTKGSDFIGRTVLAHYVEAESTTIGKSAGTLSDVLIYEGIEFQNLKWLPKGNRLKIQKLEISLKSLSAQGLNIKIHNGRLKFSGSDGIIFYGDCQSGILNVAAYANSIGVRDTLDLFADSAELKAISGFLKNVDIYVKGSFLEPEIQGDLFVENLSRNEFLMVNCPVKLNLKLADIRDDLRLNGEILLEKGLVSGPKTATVNLRASRIIFTGDFREPLLDLKGVSFVDNAEISIYLKGTFKQPKLALSSKPPMSQDRLLLALATNSTWKNTEMAFGRGELSGDIVKDLLDYFVFSGAGKMIAQRYQIRDISFNFNSSAVGIGATKDITDRVAVKYYLEQNGKEQGAVVSHRIGSEYKIADDLSIAGEGEFKQNDKTLQAQDDQKTDDKVILKIKKEF